MRQALRATAVYPVTKLKSRGKCGLLLGIAIPCVCAGLLLLGLLAGSPAAVDLSVTFSTRGSLGSILQTRYSNAFSEGFPGVTTILLESRNNTNSNDNDNDNDNNVLDKQSLLEVLQVHEAIQSIANFSRYCLRPYAGSPCMLISPMQFWQFSAGTVMADRDLSFTLSLFGRSNDVGLPLTPESVAGGVRYHPQLDTRVQSVSVWHLKYFWEPEGNDATLMMRDFHRQIAERVASISSSNMSSLRAVISTPITTTDSIESSIGGDLVAPVVGVTLTLVFVAVITTLTSGCTLGLGVALFGIAGSGLSVGAAAGLCALLGLSLSATTAQIMPVLLIVIGADNIFLLNRLIGTHTTAIGQSSKKPTKQPKQQKQHQITRESVLAAVEIGGPSIILAASAICSCFLISLVAFRVPAITELCAHVIFALLFTLILHLVSLPALMILILGQSGVTKRPFYLHRKCCNANPYLLLLRSLLSNVGTWLVIIVFAGLLALTVVGTTRLIPGLSVSDLFAPDSAAGKYQHVLERHYSGAEQYPYYAVYGARDLPESFERVRAVFASAEQHVGPLLVNWPSVFISWIAILGNHAAEWRQAGNRVPAVHFYRWLREFLDSDVGRLFERDFVWTQNGTVLWSRVLGNIDLSLGRDITPLVDVSVQAQRAVAPPANASADTAFVFSPVFPAIGQFYDLPQRSVATVLCSLAIISLLAALFVYRGRRCQNPKLPQGKKLRRPEENNGWKAVATGIVHFVTLVLVLVSTLGLFALSGLQFNVVTVLSCTAGMGMASEYVYHQLNLYWEHHGDVLASADDVGASIVLSVTSSIMGMLMLLALAKTTLVRYYFGAVWCIVFASAALHSFLLVPVLFSLAMKITGRLCGVSRENDAPQDEVGEQRSNEHLCDPSGSDDDDDSGDIDEDRQQVGDFNEVQDSGEQE